MTWVKICGITNLEDALVAVDAGADAVGFVFHRKSPRYAGVETATEIAKKLPETVERAGVFFGAPVDEWVQVARAVRLTVVQHYMPLEPDVQSHQRAITDGAFSIPPNFVLALPISLLIEADAPLDELGADLKHFRDEAANGQQSFDEKFDTFLLDSGGVRSPGGSGKTFDWHRAVSMVEAMRSNKLKPVVAGGLTPNNVREAIDVLHPWGVDVSSGVEVRPGKKDPEKVRAFVRAVREYDARVG